MTLQAGFEALENEAHEWDDTSTTLVTAEGRVAGLYLSQAEFSWLASTTGVDGSYEDARAFVISVLGAGATETERLGNALRRIRADYDSTDQHVRDAVRADWQLER
jgi:hypothetical protein